MIRVAFVIGGYPPEEHKHRAAGEDRLTEHIGTTNHQKLAEEIIKA